MAMLVQLCRFMSDKPNCLVRAASRIDVGQAKLSGIGVREKHSGAECLAKPNRSFFNIEHLSELHCHECAANAVEAV